MVSRFPYLLCAASKVRWGPLLPPPAFILNSHEVVEHFQTKASSYPAGTDGSPTLNLSETKEDSNRKKKKNPHRGSPHPHHRQHPHPSVPAEGRRTRAASVPPSFGKLYRPADNIVFLVNDSFDEF